MMAEPVAVADDVREEMRMPHEILGAKHVPLTQKRADVGGADGDAVKLDLIDHIACKAVCRTVIAQAPGISLTAPAEAEIVADDKADDAELCLDAAQKLLPRHMHRLLREAEKLHAVDAEQPPDEIRAVRRAVDERHGRALHERVRVRVEGHNGTFDTERFGALDRAVQKRRVAAVYAVKKSKSENAFSLCHE